MALVHQISALRKFSEDPRLRPFLSSHFDSQLYIKNIISTGASEECFKDIFEGIDEVNEEIKRFISTHKNDLMSGMQDVALLAERYSNLCHTAKRIRCNIDKLKREVGRDKLKRLRFPHVPLIHLLHFPQKQE